MPFCLLYLYYMISISNNQEHPGKNGLSVGNIVGVSLTPGCSDIFTLVLSDDQFLEVVLVMALFYNKAKPSLPLGQILMGLPH